MLPSYLSLSQPVFSGKVLSVHFRATLFPRSYLPLMMIFFGLLLGPSFGAVPPPFSSHHFLRRLAYPSATHRTIRRLPFLASSLAYDQLRSGIIWEILSISFLCCSLTLRVWRKRRPPPELPRARASPPFVHVVGFRRLCKTRRSVPLSPGIPNGYDLRPSSPCPPPSR